MMNHDVIQDGSTTGLTRTFRDAVTTVDGLGRFIRLQPDEGNAIDRVAARYPWRITEYYASLMDPEDEECPIRRQAVPSVSELGCPFGEDDPLEEEANSPVPGVIRVYPDRVAVIVTDRCPVYCRHCLRKRFGRSTASDLAGDRLDRVVAYVAGDRTIRDVLLTGGDPLMLSDDRLDAIIGRFRAIGHVEIVRIGTRAPCTWPERVTPALAAMLASHHPLWVSTQFNHPRELTEDAARACDLLLRRGIPVNNQSVLLGGVNDDVETMRELVRGLVRLRVRPYYLYQAQTLRGTGHFVTPIERGLEIIRGLRGRTTGFAVPQYVLDTPYGKIPLDPRYLRGREGEYMVMESFDGRVWREYNPLEGTGGGAQ